MSPRRYPTVALLTRYPALATLIQADEKGSWSWKDEILASGKSGDIVKVTNKKGDTGYVVILMEKDGRGFHYYPSDEQGKLNEDAIYGGLINHSNMFFREDELQIVGHVPVKEESFKEFKWDATGNELIDAKLANVDDRVALFRKYAPARLHEEFKSNEAHNVHAENAEMLYEFAEHLARGGTPENFSIGA